MSLREEVLEIAQKAKASISALSLLPTEIKNKTLKEMAKVLRDNGDYLQEENTEDIKIAKEGNFSSAFIDRLRINEKRIAEMAKSLEEIAQLPDPVGEVIDTWKRPNGLIIAQMRVPIGVIGIIYEARPNVTSDCIGLCLKSGNSVVLRGGSEAINSNRAIFNLLQKVALQNGIPEGAIQMIPTTDRKAVEILLGLNNYIDLIIPRGGESLIREVTKRSKIPVIKHYKGVCHIFVDESADLNMAVKVCFNAKVQRPATCNAMETMLVHKDIAEKFLPLIAREFKKAGVKIKGCKRTKKILKDIELAKEKDFYTEWLDLILSVKIVNNIDEAIAHIAQYGTQHSDAIITEDKRNAFRFLREVDSAAVYVNASTRLTDGYQFGLGAEMGVSTERIHCRGPMGLRELTTYKYIVLGNGQIRK
ncbi:MAG: glutamate-5-semialdehyde dehydrogenase [Candidatus Omnitrophica bacterium]|nr:glutamate-5-semialdehyde dehydrogenase [Candidatus Omnitrophota bacterium]MCM8792881.1 glutamate-5-semialdehyde dehydrogenase [Candidatus Omnitrophota bacterium]